MERNESTAKPWSSTRIYWLAVICLLSVIGIWYLIRPALQTNAVKPQVAGSAVAHPSDVKITPDQLKQEADMQAGPLLAQLRKSPDDPFLLAEIGKIYYQLRQFPMATKYYEDSIRVKPDAVVLVKLGGAYHFGGDDEKAIGAWNRALRLDPNNPDALFNIGFVKWYAQGDRQAAIAAWQKLLKTNPNHPKRAQVEELLAQAKQHPETPIAKNE
ncbi:MAG TPA: tetratricopeptide repeat protein [Acidobacteriota bacterium]|nr:tetratricopeptide repeat protein [Acidobacteriota bacterium]